MQTSFRKALVMGFIVVMHGVAVVALAHVKSRVDAAPVRAPITARIITLPSEDKSAPEPLLVKTSLPTIQIEPPQLPVFDDSVVDESSRAITVQVSAAAPSQSLMDTRHAPKLITSVEYVREPMPRYPPQSRRLGEQGLVMLRVLIDEKGHACSIEIESSSGHARLDHAAREAVTRAAFRPYVEDGQPRRAVVLIPIEFYLNRTSA